MGHQITFYLDKEDSSALEARLRRMGPLVILHRRSMTGRPRQLASTDLYEEGQSNLFYCLVRPEDLDKVTMEYVPAQKHWMIDTLRSPIIEYDRCYTDERLIRRGRMYYTDGFYDEKEEWKEKTTDYLTWAKKILMLGKKTLVRDGHDYLGPTASDLIAQGKKIKE